MWARGECSLPVGLADKLLRSGCSGCFEDVVPEGSRQFYFRSRGLIRYLNRGCLGLYVLNVRGKLSLSKLKSYDVAISVKGRFGGKYVHWSPYRVSMGWFQKAGGKWRRLRSGVTRRW